MNIPAADQQAQNKVQVPFGKIYTALQRAKLVIERINEQI